MIDGAFLWRLKAEHGFPLDMALQVLARRGMVPALDGLFEAAARDGANIPRLKREVAFFVREAYAKRTRQRLQPPYASSSCAAYSRAQAWNPPMLGN